MTKCTLKIPGLSVIAVTVLLLSGLSLLAQEGSSPKPTVNYAQYSGVSAPASELDALPQLAQYGFAHVPDRVEQGPIGQVSNLSLTFIHQPGISYTGFARPDTNMAVGDKTSGQVVQWVNDSYIVCDKATITVCSSLHAFNTLFPTTPPTLCSTHNDGQPIVQFDRAAHRWLLAQNVFTFPYAVCIAVSDTPDALGTYHVWQFSVPGNGYPDYPKWGIWSNGGGQSDGYYQTQNNFGPGHSGFRGAQICGYDRVALLAGWVSPVQICFQLSPQETSLLPADRDSPAAPPINQGEFLIGSVNAFDNSHLSLYSVEMDFNTPSNSHIEGTNNSILIAVAPYNGSCNGSFGGVCVPQPGVPNQLQSLGDRLMYRFVYWKESKKKVTDPPGPQHWLVSQDVESSTGQIGVRWYDFMAGSGLVIASDLTVNQQGTYEGVPADTNYRWMGSIARDALGNIILGYSESNGSTMYPSIAVAFAPGGTFNPETIVVAGAASQSGPDWGGYSAMRYDPDDCSTFFYTTEYYLVPGLAWSTDISKWKWSPSPPC